jgi:hypothetical protein
MTVIFGYDKINDDNTIENNGYKFINNKPPVNLGIHGCIFKNINIHESIMFDQDKINKYISENNITFNETKVQEYKNHSYLKTWFDIEIKQIDKIATNEKYYYIIDVMDINFFENYKEASNLYLSELAVKDIQNKKSKILVLLCNETVINIKNIYKIFRSWCRTYNFPLDRITFCSGDYSVKKYKNINYIPFSIFEHWIGGFFNRKCSNLYKFHNKNLRVDIKRKIQTRSKRSKIFLNYNRRPTYDRCNLVYKLQQQNLFKHGLVSLGWNKDLINDETKKYFPDDFIDSLPISFDNSNFNDSLADTLQTQDFLDTYVSLVSESLVAPDVIFPTEKIWKPILFYHPFIVISQPGFLKQLKKFGYKTFDKWFDESYDQELDINKRLELILIEIKKLTEMSHKELQDMLYDMLPTLKYNFKLFQERSISKEFEKQLEENLC